LRIIFEFAHFSTSLSKAESVTVLSSSVTAGRQAACCTVRRHAEEGMDRCICCAGCVQLMTPVLPS